MVYYEEPSGCHARYIVHRQLPEKAHARDAPRLRWQTKVENLLVLTPSGTTKHLKRYIRPSNTLMWKPCAKSGSRAYPGLLSKFNRKHRRAGCGAVAP